MSAAKGPLESRSAPLMSEALRLSNLTVAPIGDEILVEGYLKT